MANLAEKFVRAAGDEPIAHAVIAGPEPWANDPTYGMEAFAPCDWPPGKVLPWAEAYIYLDHEYDDGFGGTDCPPTYAWTETKVLYVHEYDGATSVYSVPRHPVDCTPSF